MATVKIAIILALTAIASAAEIAGRRGDSGVQDVQNDGRYMPAFMKAAPVYYPMKAAPVFRPSKGYAYASKGMDMEEYKLQMEAKQMKMEAMLCPMTAGALADANEKLAAETAAREDLMAAMQMIETKAEDSLAGAQNLIAGYPIESPDADH